jgi:hypothetical protein
LFTTLVSESPNAVAAWSSTRKLLTVTKAAVIWYRRCGQFADLVRVYEALQVATQKKCKGTSLVILVASSVIPFPSASDMVTVNPTIHTQALHNPLRQSKWDILWANFWAVTLRYGEKIVSGVWT